MAFDKCNWVVYLLRCADGSLYCGVTNDLKKRLRVHNLGKGAKYTRSRTPVELVATSQKMAKDDAFRFEYRIKQLPVAMKVTELKSGQPEFGAERRKAIREIQHELLKTASRLRGLSDDVTRIMSRL